MAKSIELTGASTHICHRFGDWQGFINRIGMGWVMKIVPEVPNRAYVNVMELLVAEEVARQIKGMPPRLLKYLKQVEVETYALNRLPSLYASSEKGWQHQYEKAKRELHSQIKSAVRQAFAAVQVDPIRTSTPLPLKQDESAQAALENLREMFRQPELGWEDVVDRLRAFLKRPSNGASSTNPPAPPPVEGSHRTRSRPSQTTTGSGHPDSNHHYWRPGTYGGDVSWRERSWQGKKPTDTSSASDFNWDDSRYSK
jgi:hypothetical protein